MALPAGIVSKTVTVGIASFFDGSLAEGTATITAPVNVVHTPTNRPIFSSQMSHRFVDGETSFNLCPTDAPGLNRVDFAYKLVVVVQGALVQPEPVYFTLPTAGPDEIDLDSLVTVPSSAGTPISVDALTTSDLPPLVTADGPFSDALRGAFGPRRQFPTTWLALGNSLTEGTGASDREHRWLDLAVGALREAGTIPGGVGYLPTWQNTGWANVYAPWVWPAGTGFDSWGRVPAGRIAVLPAGKIATVAVTGTSVDLWVHRYPTAPTIAVKVDGGPETQYSLGAPEDGHAFRIPLGASGPHTLTIRSLGVGDGNDAAIGGVMVYNGDENTGLRLIESAYAGRTSAQVLTDLTSRWLPPIAATTPPDLVTIELGLNDLLQAPGIAPAATVANLAAIVAAVRSTAPRARIVLIHAYSPAGRSGDWQPYLDAMRDWAARHRSVDVLDWADLLGVATTSGLWNADGLHPSDAGHQRLADHFVDFILR